MLLAAIFANTGKQCLCIYTQAKTVVLLVGQHPKPFNNFSNWLRTVPVLYCIYEERHRRKKIRLCLSE